MQCTVVLGSCEITYDMEYAKEVEKVLFSNLSFNDKVKEFVKLGALVKATDLDHHVHNYL